jgi:hypothetical protein
MGTVRRLGLLLVAAAVAAPAAHAADPPPLPAPAQLVADRATFLAAAEEGLQRTQDVWADPKLGWYDGQSGSTAAQPLASLWYAFPFFEATAAVAIANPNSANKVALARFAHQAENYWDPTVADGAGAFSWYYNLRGTGNAYFDDNGWWGLAYVDAFRATGNPRWLWDADLALRFMDRFGWDQQGGGGMWWDMEHRHKTSEPLAAGAMIAAELYAYTGKAEYLALAKKYIAWADAKTTVAGKHGLYGRSDTDATVMDYVQGMMIAANASLCGSTKDGTYCAKAARLADASLIEFPILANWSPETDIVYLRGLMDLYRQDGNPRWYAVVYANGVQALANASDETGLWSKRWDGTFATPRTLYTQTATLELFAWLAAATPPA